MWKEDPPVWYTHYMDILNDKKNVRLLAVYNIATLTQRKKNERQTNEHNFIFEQSKDCIVQSKDCIVSKRHVH